VHNGFHLFWPASPPSPKRLRRTAFASIVLLIFIKIPKSFGSPAVALANIYMTGSAFA
jgi:hypothetical protein